MEIQPDIDNITIFFSDTAFIVSYSEIEDSVRSDETPSNLLGSFKDPVFGTSSAGFYTQVRLSSNDVNFGTSPVFDSLILSLAYNGYYGDSTVPQKVIIYELGEDIYRDSNYYSNRSFKFNKPELANYTFFPKPSDSVNVDGEMQAPQLRINLNQTLADKLLHNASPDNLANNYNFLTFFKGLYLKTSIAAGNGSILYFDPLSAISKLTLYYHNSTDTTSYNFVINENCARINTFNHSDYSDANAALISQAINNDTSLGQTRLYIQAMAGVRTKLQLPNLKNYFDNGKIAINSASLVITLDESDLTINDFTPPARLGLVKLDENGALYFVSDYNLGSSYFGGYYNESKKEYRFNIAKHVQEILNGDIIDYGLVLLPDKRQMTANRVVLNGPESFNNKLRLELIYTKLY